MQLLKLDGWSKLRAPPCPRKGVHINYNSVFGAKDPSIEIKDYFEELLNIPVHEREEKAKKPNSLQLQYTIPGRKRG